MRRWESEQAEWQRAIRQGAIDGGTKGHTGPQPQTKIKNPARRRLNGVLLDIIL